MLLTILFCTIIKIFLTITLFNNSLHAKQLSKLWLLLIGVLLCSLVGDISWIMKLVRSMLLPEASRGLVIFALRLAWAFLSIQYQAFALFISQFTHSSKKIHIINKLLSLPGVIISAYFIYSAFFESRLLTKLERTYYFYQSFFSSAPPEIIAMRTTILYSLLLGLWIIVLLINYVRTKKYLSLPKIINKQLLIIFASFTLPFLFYDLAMIIHFSWPQTHAFTPLIVGFSTCFFTIGLYYCLIRVLAMRFLNCKEFVEESARPQFIYHFKEIIDKLQASKTIEDVCFIGEEFFETNFHINPRNITFLLCDYPLSDNASTPKNKKLIAVKELLCVHSEKIIPILKKEKILIYDDLVLSNYYNYDEIIAILLSFMALINADVFIPLFEHERLIAFIVIEKNIRAELYSNIDRHEMILYAKYVATRIYTLLHNVNHCSHQEKKLKDDLYKKHLEIAYYKESIRSFLTTSQSQEIGIIFYSNQTFEYANESAKKIAALIGNQEFHPLLKAFKNSVQHVERYQTPYNCYTCDGKGNRYVITAVYNMTGNNYIISISRADLTESITSKIALLDNPTRFDYLLYLETTKPGHRINQLIPSSVPELLNFKVDLLEAALSKRATLIQAPTEDTAMIVNFLHEVSNRTILYTLDKNIIDATNDLHALLFGCTKTHITSLMEKLDAIGTLFIENIDTLDTKIQAQLADIIKYGFFVEPTSQKKIAAQVRIVCTVSKKIGLLAQAGFNSDLLSELKKSILSMPSLTSLNSSDLIELAEQYLQQNNNEQVTINKDLLSAFFHQYKPKSFHELKQIIHEKTLVPTEKIIQNNNYVYGIKPELAYAARLGKHALKDQALMSQLWNIFKNQAKIADYLGVNRSSVNRRCKEYSLQ